MLKSNILLQKVCC